ncbi:MAG: CorA family divalent cation transporter [Pseudomonadota bacterium]
MAKSESTKSTTAPEPNARGERSSEPCPGVVWAFRFGADGSTEELTDCKLPSGVLGHRAEDGWLWVHVNLADARVGPYMRAHLKEIPAAAVDLLLSVGDHQQLHADDVCIYGVFADLVYRLEGLSDELGLLHFVATERLLVTGRREGLHSVEAVRKSIQAGQATKSHAALLESIFMQVASGVEERSATLSDELDVIEERLIVDLDDDIPKRLAKCRRLAVRLHRILATQRSVIARFEQNNWQTTGKAHDLKTSHIGQRLDWLDHEMVALRDRAHLLQEEVSLRMTDQTNRNLQLLTIVTTVFLPAGVISSIFGMNVGGLPLVNDRSGFIVTMLLLIGASGLVFWVLKRMGMLRR